VECALSGGADGSLRLLALADGTPRGEAFCCHEGWVVSCAASRDGSCAYSAGADGQARLLPLPTAAPGPGAAAGPPSLSATASATPGEGPLTCLELAREGSLVLTCAASGALHTWRADNLHPLGSFWGHTGGVCGAALSRGGELALTLAGGQDRSVRLWRASAPGAAAALMASPPPGPGGDSLDEPTCLAASGDCLAAYVGYASGALRSWRTADGVVTRTLPPRAEGSSPGALRPSLLPAAVCALALSRGEDRLAVCYADGVVRLLRVTPAAFAVTHVLVGHRDALPCLRLSKDGAVCVAGGAEGCLRAWRPGGMPNLPSFSRAACLTVSSRSPGCVPANLQRVIGAAAASAGKEIMRRGAEATERVKGFIADKRTAGAAAEAVAAPHQPAPDA